MPTDHRDALATTADGAIRVVTARSDELAALLDIQREAFGRIAREFGVPADRLPPVNETLDELEALCARGMLFLVALAEEERVVGTVRGERLGDTVEVGRLAVGEPYLRRGIASALMRGLEAAFPDAVRFDLFTGAEAAGPIRLYERLGYRIYATEQLGDWSLVRLAKSAHEALG